jgi:hypothetical protein
MKFCSLSRRILKLLINRNFSEPTHQKKNIIKHSSKNILGGDAMRKALKILFCFLIASVVLNGLTITGMLQILEQNRQLSVKNQLWPGN